MSDKWHQCLFTTFWPTFRAKSLWYDEKRQKNQWEWTRKGRILHIYTYLHRNLRFICRKIGFASFLESYRCICPNKSLQWNRFPVWKGICFFVPPRARRWFAVFSSKAKNRTDLSIWSLRVDFSNVGIFAKLKLSNGNIEHFFRIFRKSLNLKSMCCRPKILLPCHFWFSDLSTRTDAKLKENISVAFALLYYHKSTVFSPHRCA